MIYRYQTILSALGFWKLCMYVYIISIFSFIKANKERIDITLCSPLKVNTSFGRTYRLHLQGRKISLARNQRESKWQAVCITTAVRTSNPTYRPDFLIGNALVLHSGGAWFESQAGHRLFWLKIFMGLLQPPNKLRDVPRLGHHGFLPNPFQFIIPSTRHYTVCLLTTLLNIQQQMNRNIISRVWVTISTGFWVGYCIYWPLIHTTRNYK
jgi:hypothetical protein